MRAEEDGHRHRLIELYRQKFGEHIPLIRRQDVKGLRRPQAGLAGAAAGSGRGPQAGRADGAGNAAGSTNAPSARRPMPAFASCWATWPRRSASTCASAEELETAARPPGPTRKRRRPARRLFVLQVVQPGLAGLMDGSVSTLAPLFAAAFATHNSWDTFLVGLAASLGAGISMGFAEALSDDGSLTGRGRPLAARLRLRPDDGPRRPGPHAAVS